MEDKPEEDKPDTIFVVKLPISLPEDLSRDIEKEIKDLVFNI